MKVVLIFNILPEEVNVYLLEGDTAELAIKCNNVYLGSSEATPEQEADMLMLLTELPHVVPTLKLTQDGPVKPIDLTCYNTLVMCGQYL